MGFKRDILITNVQRYLQIETDLVDLTTSLPDSRIWSFFLFQDPVGEGWLYPCRHF